MARTLQLRESLQRLTHERRWRRNITFASCSTVLWSICARLITCQEYVPYRAMSCTLQDSVSEKSNLSPILYSLPSSLGACYEAFSRLTQTPHARAPAETADKSLRRTASVLISSTATCWDGRLDARRTTTTSQRACRGRENIDRMARSGLAKPTARRVSGRKPRPPLLRNRSFRPATCRSW